MDRRRGLRAPGAPGRRARSGYVALPWEKGIAMRLIFRLVVGVALAAVSMTPYAATGDKAKVKKADRSGFCLKHPKYCTAGRFNGRK